MAIKYANCRNCNEEFDLSITKKCPECKTIFDESAPKIPDRIKSEMELLLEAQNRTTHAVRSLAITFVAFPIILSGLVLLLAVSFYFQSIAIMLISFIGIIIAFIFIASSSIESLRQSRIPD